MAIGIGIGVPFGNAFSWSTYWTTQSEVLFFGEISKITGDKLYNQKSGATDYLTVGGTAGSYTFQCPNTAPYIAADTDYIWFKTDTTQRTTTEAELVGYDFPRTPVKYDDDTPYAIRWIAILKSGVTLSESDNNKLHQSFNLPIFWSGVFNLYGHIKSNRPLAQQLWTPEVLWTPEISTYITGLITPLSNPHLTLLDNFVKALKTGLSISNLSDAFDVIHVYANETEEAALRNFVVRTNDATKVIAPAFVALEGFTGEEGGGTDDDAINTNFNPKIQGSKYTVNNCSLGVYSRTDATGMYYVIGAFDGTNYTGINLRAATAPSVGINAGVYNIAGNASTTTLGLFVLERSAGNISIYQNGVLNRTRTQTVTDIPNIDLYVCASNFNTVTATTAPHQISLFFAGRYFTVDEIIVITNAFEAYMDANGKGVIA